MNFSDIQIQKFIDRREVKTGKLTPGEVIEKLAADVREAREVAVKVTEAAERVAQKEQRPA